MSRPVSTGRIRPYEREATENVEIIGASLQLVDDHQQGLDETNEHARKVATTRNYWNRIQHIITFMESSYPEYCALGGVRDLGRITTPAKTVNFFGE